MCTLQEDILPSLDVSHYFVGIVYVPVMKFACLGSNETYAGMVTNATQH